MSVIKPRKLKNYFIKPGFQSRLAAIMVLVVIIVANIVGAIAYGVSCESLKSFCNDYHIPDGPATIGRLLMPGILIAELVSVFIASLLCVTITHIVAGPVYRMERVVRGIGEGDLTNFIKLRQRDELKDLADSMNEMTLGLRNKVINIKENFEEVRNNFEGLRSSLPDNKFVEISQKLNNIDETLQNFILEKEQRKRFEYEEDSADDESESNGNNDSNDKSDSLEDSSNKTEVDNKEEIKQLTE